MIPFTRGNKQRCSTRMSRRGNSRDRNAIPKFVIVYSERARLLSHFTCLGRTHRLTMSIMSLVNPLAVSPCICRVSRATIPPVYARQTRTLPPGLASLPMYNQFTVHRSAATISDNYRERNSGRRGCFCRVSAKSTQLNAKLNSSSEKLLTNNRPFSSLSHQFVFNSCHIQTNKN